MTVEELYQSIGGNYPAAKGRLMNDRLISKFIVKYLNDPSYDDFCKAWEAQDSEQIFRTAHTLKGVCANLALDRLFVNASAICEAYRPAGNGRLSEKEVRVLVEEMRADYEATTEKIRQFAAQ